jgi:hypothetical protein
VTCDRLHLRRCSPPRIARMPQCTAGRGNCRPKPRLSFSAASI